MWKEDDLFVQRIPMEKEFIDDAIERAAPFVKLAILLELVGKKYGAMIGCDNEHCLIQWFHFSCLKIKPSHTPKGKWYCPECHKSKKGKAKRLYNDIIMLKINKL